MQLSPQNHEIRFQAGRQAVNLLFTGPWGDTHHGAPSLLSGISALPSFLNWNPRPSCLLSSSPHTSYNLGSLQPSQWTWAPCRLWHSQQLLRVGFLICSVFVPRLCPVYEKNPPEAPLLIQIQPSFPFKDQLGLGEGCLTPQAHSALPRLWQVLFPPAPRDRPHGKL